MFNYSTNQASLLLDFFFTPKWLHLGLMLLFLFHPFAANAVDGKIYNGMACKSTNNVKQNSLDCRSSLCRMELSHDDNQSREILGAQVSMLLDYPTDGIIYSVDNGTDTPDTVVYFTREGQELPDLANF